MSSISEPIHTPIFFPPTTNQDKAETSRITTTTTSTGVRMHPARKPGPSPYLLSLSRQHQSIHDFPQSTEPTAVELHSSAERVHKLHAKVTALVGNANHDPGAPKWGHIVRLLTTGYGRRRDKYFEANVPIRDNINDKPQLQVQPVEVGVAPLTSHTEEAVALRNKVAIWAEAVEHGAIPSSQPLIPPSSQPQIPTENASSSSSPAKVVTMLVAGSDDDDEEQDESIGRKRKGKSKAGPATGESQSKLAFPVTRSSLTSNHTKGGQPATKKRRTSKSKSKSKERESRTRSVLPDLFPSDDISFLPPSFPTNLNCSTPRPDAAAKPKRKVSPIPIDALSSPLIVPSEIVYPASSQDAQAHVDKLLTTTRKRSRSSTGSNEGRTKKVKTTHSDNVKVNAIVPTTESFPVPAGLLYKLRRHTPAAAHTPTKNKMSPPHTNANAIAGPSTPRAVEPVTPPRAAVPTLTELLASTKRSPVKRVGNNMKNKKTMSISPVVVPIRREDVFGVPTGNDNDEINDNENEDKDKDDGKDEDEVKDAEKDDLEDAKNPEEEEKDELEDDDDDDPLINPHPYHHHHTAPSPAKSLSSLADSDDSDEREEKERERLELDLALSHQNRNQHGNQNQNRTPTTNNNNDNNNNALSAVPSFSQNPSEFVPQHASSQAPRYLFGNLGVESQSQSQYDNNDNHTGAGVGAGYFVTGYNSQFDVNGAVDRTSALLGGDVDYGYVGGGGEIDYGEWVNEEEEEEERGKGKGKGRREWDSDESESE